ncbi:TRZ/ATZ family hydrolase [Teredinibacter sp. KSP-S5-2]|uniref:TRZ/ATZ family hydrolase n=1 Tax=Teredinibacter sp. KSP-S5-2 TaxID=3034506 RepID=UPI002934B1F1|nr:TRZ/ATZ family hydrolase [Teredinibacter sp. KSP-S5-2]WNO07879.1 TRZ/ATZ family hydrolase [Teredinibacter sp. KSP-S5-2]
MESRQIVQLIISPRWIVPIVPRGRIIEGCSLIVDQGVIQSICPTHEVEKKYQAKEHIELKGHALLPGLINVHGHLAMSLLRGYADDLALEPWLQDHIWPAEKQWVSEEFVRDGTQLAIAEMLSSGTTCFSDMYFFPEEAAAVTKEMGMRAQFCFPILDFPSNWAQTADDYIHKGLKLHDDYRSNDLINVGFGPHAPYSVSDEALSRVAVCAEELQAPIQIHLHETAHEINESVERYGKRPIERIYDLGLLTPNTQCVHFTQSNEQDIELLKASGSHIIHCPESNLKLNNGICSTQQLIDAEINVCLGTDGAASNNDLDLFGEMRTTALIGKLQANNPSAVDATTVLEMATINGAKALGMESLIGSLTPGKQADMIAVDMSAINTLPMYNILSQLVYAAKSTQVSHTWVAGKLLYQNTGFSKISKAGLREKAQLWHSRINRK